MQQEIIEKIKDLKRKYEPEGFVILGVFGSYARGEETAQSDIDILYEMKDNFYNRFSGWDVYARIEDIKKEIHQITGWLVDLADKNGLKRVGEKYILPEVVYV
ncbi:nucleotidyltransferase domain-containing protein [Candidatus Desantisbacteria bacterium]|nr:nucleotidyltransferase domain-containing protein [Candidatus Desantisbacteria bacterium]